ncbi:hypothetical protein [Streptomyces sp. NPDC006368]|uniref:hypothetical protein n=1 Tax=Streptomyces sp. NPDC006368 TaxID=3156760 RepID=UPI0033A6E2A3
MHVVQRDWLAFAVGFPAAMGFAFGLLLLHRAAWSAVLAVVLGVCVVFGAIGQIGVGGLIVGMAGWTVLAAVAGWRGHVRRRRGITPWWDRFS